MRAVLGIAIAVGGVALLAYTVYHVRVQPITPTGAAGVSVAQGIAAGVTQATSTGGHQ